MNGSFGLNTKDTHYTGQNANLLQKLYDCPFADNH